MVGVSLKKQAMGPRRTGIWRSAENPGAVSVSISGASTTRAGSGKRLRWARSDRVGRSCASSACRPGRSATITPPVASFSAFTLFAVLTVLIGNLFEPSSGGRVQTDGRPSGECPEARFTSFNSATSARTLGRV